MTFGPQLEGKVAVVTGAASGIGGAVAKLYGEHQAHVAVVDLKQEDATQVAAGIAKQGGTAEAWALEVTDAAATEKVTGGVADEFGGSDILVTAAGILDQQDFLEVTEETFDRTIGIDHKGVFLSGRYAAPYMVKRGGGRIINIASQTAIKGAVSLAHYVAAKAGV